MKNRLKTLSLILVILCAIVFIACSSSSDGDSYEGVINEYNDNITYQMAYVSEDACPGGNILDRNLRSSLNFVTGKTYYMVVDFTISSFSAEGWNSSFSSQIRVSPAYAVSAKLEEASTSNFSEKADDYGTHVTTTYAIPENKSAAKSYRVIVQFVFKTEGLVNVDLTFYGDGESAESAVVAEESIGNSVTAGLKYELNGDGNSYYVAGIGKAIDKNIIIPSVYRDLPVTEIGVDAFRSNKNITSVNMPNSVTKIGEYAFCGCSALKSIEFPDSLKTLCNNAFYGCTGLTSVTLPGSIYYMGSGTFSGCTGLTSVIILNGITSVSGFEGCSSLTTVTISDSVTRIDTKAFYNCSSLKNLTLPDSLLNIDGYAFAGCSKLTSITIPYKVKSIGHNAFKDSGITSAVFKNPLRWDVVLLYDSYEYPSESDLSDPAKAAQLLTDTYCDWLWSRS